MLLENPAPRARFADLNRLTLPIRLGSFTGEILGWDYVQPRWWRNYAHAHSFYEVRYAFQGEATFRIGGAAHEVRAGDLFVARPGEVHEIILSERDPVGLYHWSFALAAPRRSLPASTGVDALLSAFTTTHAWLGPALPAVEPTIEMLTEEAVRREPGYQQAIGALVSKLLLDTCRTIVREPLPVEPESPAAHNSAETLVQRMVTFLQDNYDRPLAVCDVAGEVYLSERHANRLFHQVMGVSILEHLTALRMEVAARRLLDPDCSIKEIAQQCGYANVAYFTTLFHRRLGVTPAAFRRRHTGEVLAAVQARAGLRRPDPERTRLDTRLLPL